MADRLVRKVQFFRFRSAEPDAPLSSIRSDHLDMVSRHEQANTAHLSNEDGRVLLGRVVHNDSRRSMALYRVRYDELPARERGGEVGFLDLADDEGLAEPIHAVFFPGHVVGVLYNHQGPRAGRLADYLNEKCGLSLLLEPVFRTDPLPILGRFDDIRKVHLRISEEHLGALRSEERLFQSAHAMSLLGAGPVEVAAIFPLQARDSATDLWRPLLGRLLTGPARPALERAKVWGFDPETGRVEALDLLLHKIEVEREVERAGERGRVVADQSAIGAITDAYELVEAEIRKSTSDDADDGA